MKLRRRSRFSSAPPKHRDSIRPLGHGRLIWTRDQSACTSCGSSFALEEDHITPKVVGGQYTLENMRLLCRACNRRAAVEKFGVGKMEASWN